MAKKEFEQTFTIDRSKWKNRRTFTDSNLLTCLYSKDEKGRVQMCCLGFVCNQLGIPKRDLDKKRVPNNLCDDWDIPYLLNGRINTTLAMDAISINDSSRSSSSKKEVLLKKLFNSYNLDLKFVGEYKGV
jgi:hypothetical protein